MSGLDNLSREKKGLIFVKSRLFSVGEWSERGVLGTKYFYTRVGE